MGYFMILFFFQLALSLFDCEIIVVDSYMCTGGSGILRQVCPTDNVVTPCFCVSSESIPADKDIVNIKQNDHIDTNTSNQNGKTPKPNNAEVEEGCAPVYGCLAQCGTFYCSEKCALISLRMGHDLLCVGRVSETLSTSDNSMDIFEHPLMKFKNYAVSTNEVFLLAAQVRQHGIMSNRNKIVFFCIRLYAPISVELF